MLSQFCVLVCAQACVCTFCSTLIHNKIQQQRKYECDLFLNGWNNFSNKLTALQWTQEYAPVLCTSRQQYQLQQQPSFAHFLLWFKHSHKLGNEGVFCLSSKFHVTARAGRQPSEVVLKRLQTSSIQHTCKEYKNKTRQKNTIVTQI
jgi:hypothetical protein